jgi:hypothetical protein
MTSFATDAFSRLNYWLLIGSGRWPHSASEDQISEPTNAIDADMDLSPCRQQR